MSEHLQQHGRGYPYAVDTTRTAPDCCRERTRISDVKVSGGFSSVALSINAIAADQLPAADTSYLSRLLDAQHITHASGRNGQD